MTARPATNSGCAALLLAISSAHASAQSSIVVDFDSMPAGTSISLAGSWSITSSNPIGSGNCARLSTPGDCNSNNNNVYEGTIWIDLPQAAPVLEVSLNYYFEGQEAYCAGNSGVDYTALVRSDGSFVSCFQMSTNPVSGCDMGASFGNGSGFSSVVAGIAEDRIGIFFSTVDGYWHSGYLVIDDITILAQLDCNGNGVYDAEDIATGASLDCNANGIPDECDASSGLDCNGNGIPDSCEIASGFAVDCDSNGVPDECDIANDPVIDANLNNIPDLCEAAGSRSWILSPVTGNWYAITDELDVKHAQLMALNWGGHLVTIDGQAENDWLAGTFGDASTPIWTGYNDADVEGTFEWVSGAAPGFTAWDTSAGQPDNMPGVFGGADFAVLEPISGLWYDESFVASSFGPGLPRGVVEVISSDCDGNGVPDTYELLQDPSLDCDGNGIHDLCDLQDPALDCDNDGVLDSCQIAADPALDCDGNGAIDSCEILSDPSLDCDANQTLDVCQITADPSLDWNSDGLLDNCAGGGFVFCDSNINAAGLNASIDPGGSPLVSDDAFCLRAYNLPAGTPGVPGMFIMSRFTDYVNPFGGGAGVLCLGSPIRRLGPNEGFPLDFSGAAGEITLCPPLASLPGPNPVQPGEFIHFQMWFRDIDLTTGVPTSNTTDGISVMFR